MPTDTKSLRTPKVRRKATKPDVQRYAAALEARGWRLDWPGTYGCRFIAEHRNYPDKILKYCEDAAWTEYAWYCINRYRLHGCRGTERLLRVYALRELGGATVAVIEKLEKHEMGRELFWDNAQKLINPAPKRWQALTAFVNRVSEHFWDLHPGNFMVRTGPRGGKTLVCIDPIAYRDDCTYDGGGYEDGLSTDTSTGTSAVPCGAAAPFNGSRSPQQCADDVPSACGLDRPHAPDNGLGAGQGLVAGALQGCAA